MRTNNTTNNTKATANNTEEFKYFTTMDTIVHEIINSDDFVHNIVKEVKKATKKAAKKATKKATKKAAKKAVKKAIKRNNVAEKAFEKLYDPMTAEDATANTKEFENTYNPVEDAIATVKGFEKKAEVKYSMTGEKVDYDDNVEW